jgi:hypothetical protein
MEQVKDEKTLQYEAEREEKLEELQRRKERDIARRQMKKSNRHVWAKVERED